MEPGTIETLALSEARTQLDIELKIKQGAENLLAVFANAPTRSSSNNGSSQSLPTSKSAAPIDKLSTTTGATAVNASTTATAGNDNVPIASANPADNAALKAQVEQELAAANARVTALENRIRRLSLNMDDYHSIRSPVPPTPSEVDHPYYEPSVTDLYVSTPADFLEQLNSLNDSTFPDSNDQLLNSLSHAIQLDSSLPYDLHMSETISAIIPSLSDNAGQDSRTAAYRLIRFLCNDSRAITEIFKNHIDIYIVRTLARDPKHDLEKMQAILLIRQLMTPFPTLDSLPLTPSIVRALVALAENKDDVFRQIALETVAELIIIDIDLAHRSDALNVIFDCLTSGPTILSSIISSMFPFLLDLPRYRSHLRLGMDLEVALIDFTGANPSKTSYNMERLRTSAGIVSNILKSWSGLLYLCLDKKRALKSLIDALTIPADTVREILMDTFGQIFNLSASSPAASNIASYFNSTSNTSSSKSISSPSDRTNLIDQYYALLLLVLVDCGLLERLVDVAESSPKLAQKSSVLIGHILQLSARVLPLQYGAKFQALPRLFALASGFNQGDSRLIGSSALRLVDDSYRNMSSNNANNNSKDGSNQDGTANLTTAASMANFNFNNTNITTATRRPSIENNASVMNNNNNNYNNAGGMGSMITPVTPLAQSHANFDSSAINTAASGGGDISNPKVPTTPTTITSPIDRLRSNSFDEPLRRGQLQIESSKLRMAMQIDDASFRNKLIESQVLSSKDPSKWSFDIITQLFEGPLLNAKRLEEATRGTKFIRRVIQFYHPAERKYSDLKKAKNNEKYTLLGCTIMSTLLANHEGVRFLGDDKFLQQIAEILVDLDPLAAPHDSSKFLSKQRMETTLSSGYFEMLGTLSGYPEGIALMERFKLFTILYRLTERKSREDISAAIIEKLRYDINGHARIILSKAMMSNYKNVRLLATRRVERLLREWENKGDREWLMEMMVTQLYDPSPEIRELAVQVIDEACESVQDLEAVVRMRPSLHHLDDISAPLLFRFLSTPIGVRYLHEIEYIDREMEDWFDYRNDIYTVQVETYLSKAFGTDKDREDVIMLGFDGRAPRHFYGEIIKTQEGREILRNKGHFAEFSRIIKQHGFECVDAEIIAKVKSALWAVGNIAATSGGLLFLEEEDLIQKLVDISKGSKCFTMRGTCFFIMGLISSTVEGADLLEDYGWEAVCTPVGQPRGLCVPFDLDSLVCVTEDVRSNVDQELKEKDQREDTEDKAEENEEEEEKKENEEEEEKVQTNGQNIGKGQKDNVSKAGSFGPYDASNSGRRLATTPSQGSFGSTAMDNDKEDEIIDALIGLPLHLHMDEASRTLARAKAKDKDGKLFSSPRLAWWALHLMGTRHYALAARRYVFEMFSDCQPLDPMVVSKIFHAGELELEQSNTHQRLASISWKAWHKDAAKRRRRAETNKPDKVKTQHAMTVTKGFNPVV